MVTRAASSLQVPGAERQGLGIFRKLRKLGVGQHYRPGVYHRCDCPVYIPSGYVKIAIENGHL